MKDEIKEILDNVKKCCDITKDQSFTVYQRQDILKLLDYITNLQEENERLKDKLNIDLKWALKCDDLVSKIDKAIENIDLVIELIKQQPTEDDTWILNKLNGFKYLLQGEDKEIEQLKEKMKTLYKYTPEKGFRLVGDDNE